MMTSAARRRFAAYLIVILLCLLPCKKAAAQRVAIRANALSLALLTPELGVDFITSDHTSLVFSAFGHYKPYGLNSKMWGLQGEFRYWFNGRPLTREYIGATVLGTSYDMNLTSRVYAGTAIGLGVIGGYSFILGERWSLDLTAGTGLMAFHQKYYHAGDRYEDYYADAISAPNTWGFKFFPVKLSVAFVYIIR